MHREIQQEYEEIYRLALLKPFFGTLREWAEKNIELPSAYAISGRLDLGISRYLLKPSEALLDPLIMQVNLCMATQIGKSFLSELFIPYVICNAPGPMLRVFHDQNVSDLFTSQRLIPLLKNCAPVAPLLKWDRFSTGKHGVFMAHMAVVCGSANTGLQHGVSMRYLLCEELHQWEPGQFGKFLARTTAFAGRRKIVCASQPGRAGGEWEQLCDSGLIYEWQWFCPKCGTGQPWYWSKEKKGGYAGFNWDTILMPDGETTNIGESSKTTWLECHNCDGRIHDTPAERRYLGDTCEYVLTKRNGDPSIVTFMAPGFVNPNISFASKAAEYMTAKRHRKITGLDELMEIFVEQTLGRFYKKEDSPDGEKMLVEYYEKENLDKDWILTMGVDCQRTGGIKYYVIRAWKKDGTESRRIAFGIARTYDEIEALRLQHKIAPIAVHVDSGDGTMTSTIYQECIKHGVAQRLTSGVTVWNCWSPTKGDQEKSYKHVDKITRFYSPPSPQDAQFPAGHKLQGIAAQLILFSNFSLKTILGRLRDGKIEGVKWVIDRPDEEYDKQMFSEGIVQVVDKKSGLLTERWQQLNVDNHFYDCEVLNLLGAFRFNAFLATTGLEDEQPKPAPAPIAPLTPPQTGNRLSR